MVYLLGHLGRLTALRVPPTLLMEGEGGGEGLWKAVLTRKEGTTRGRADVAAGAKRMWDMSHPDREGVFSRAVNTDWT